MGWGLVGCVGVVPPDLCTKCRGCVGVGGVGCSGGVVFFFVCRTRPTTKVARDPQLKNYTNIHEAHLPVISLLIAPATEEVLRAGGGPFSGRLLSCVAGVVMVRALWITPPPPSSPSSRVSPRVASLAIS